MNYNFRFNALLPYADEIVRGIVVTLQLTCLTMAIALVIGLFVALARMSDNRGLSALARVYVEAIRNTPLLVQLFIVFFGLPSLGIPARCVSRGDHRSVDQCRRLCQRDPSRAGVRFGSRPSQIEAGRALGLTAGQTFRSVVLFPAIKAIYSGARQPVRAVAARHQRGVVPGRGRALPSPGGLHTKPRTYRSFEAYALITVTYLILTLAVRALFSLVYWLVFVRRPRT